MDDVAKVLLFRPVMYLPFISYIARELCKLMLSLFWVKDLLSCNFFSRVGLFLVFLSFPSSFIG